MCTPPPRLESELRSTIILPSAPRQKSSVPQKLMVEIMCVNTTFSPCVRRWRGLSEEDCRQLLGKYLAQRAHTHTRTDARAQAQWCLWTARCGRAAGCEYQRTKGRVRGGLGLMLNQLMEHRFAQPAPAGGYAACVYVESTLLIFKGIYSICVLMHHLDLSSALHIYPRVPAKALSLFWHPRMKAQKVNFSENLQRCKQRMSILGGG